MILFLLACASGPAAESLIPDLRVISAVAEPPEIGPSESTTVSVTLGDPANDGAEVLMWTCLPDGDGGCLESRGAQRTWAVVAQDDSASLTAPAATAQLLSDAQPVLPVPLYTLACAPGLCPIIDQVRADPSPGTAAWAELNAQLADPFTFMTELPFEGVALATQRLTVSLLPPEQRNTNPVLTVPSSGPIRATTALDDSASIELDVTDSDEVTVYGFSTLGGFGPASADVFGGTATLEWLPGPDAEAGTAGSVWVVAVDARGGSAVWQGTVEVTAP